ncbi:MAG: hypothetical protein V4648_08960 [Bacteroidota bacterium]
MKTTNLKNSKNNLTMSLKNMIAYVMMALLSVVSVSCDNSDDSPSPGGGGGVGSADITLTAGGQQFKVVGPCGWAVAGGANYIGANHNTNSQRVFSSYFNISTLPTVTTTYTLKEYDVNDNNPTHITMNMSEIAGSTLTEWSSKDSSGTLTLVVNGNTVTANLAGITLYPQTSGGVFTNGNTGAFANNGTMSGTLTFYRD